MCNTYLLLELGCQFAFVVDCNQWIWSGLHFPVVHKAYWTRRSRIHIDSRTLLKQSQGLEEQPRSACQAKLVERVKERGGGVVGRRGLEFEAQEVKLLAIFSFYPLAVKMEIED